MESDKKPEARNPGAPNLRIVNPGDSQSDLPDVPQISLEHILELKKVEYSALMIKREFEAQYASAIEAMIEERIQAKAEEAYAGGRITSSGKREVRVEFSRRFFSGEHRRIAGMAFESIAYPEGVDKFKIYREKIYLLYKSMLGVSCAASEMFNYLNGIKKRKDLENMRKKKEKKKPHPAAEETKRYFSEAEESRIHDYIWGICSSVEAYNSAVAEFASSLQGIGGVELDSRWGEEKVMNANLALEQIMAAQHDESLVQAASSSARALHEVAGYIDGIRSMIGVYLDFSHIKWGSMDFGSYLAKRGFSVTEKKYATFTRAVHAVGEIEIPEKPNPQP